MRRKRVRFVGNCQASALAGFYRDFVGGPNGEDVIAIQDLGLDAAGLRQAVQDADVLVVQERDFKSELSPEEIGRSIEIYQFPMIMTGFLWPFANEAHIYNVTERPISDGPYPAQMGDSFLNRLIKKGVSAEDALDQYLQIDIAKVASLDRLFEIYLQRQRQRDAMGGYGIASAIEANFRSKKLMLTAEHPDHWLFGVLADHLFQLMNVPAAVIATALETLVRSPFPPTELPLHPGVIAHFGLPFADENTRYTYMDEGRFTFAETVRRYMRYESNQALREGIYMVGREDPSISLSRLETALAQSPQSSAGFRAKGEALRQLGRHEEAIAAYQRAIELDPDNPYLHVDLARMLSQAGQSDRAEQAALHAVEKGPKVGAAHVILGEARIYGGRPADAVEPAREGARLAPGYGHSYRKLAMALHATAQHVEAEQAIRRAILIEPDDPNHRNLLAEILHASGKADESIGLLEECLQTGCKNDQTYSLLGNFLLWRDMLERSEAIFWEGAELYGHHRPDLHACMVQVQQMRAAA